jgi:hypothetical protein
LLSVKVLVFTDSLSDCCLTLTQQISAISCREQDNFQ